MHSNEDPKDARLDESPEGDEEEGERWTITTQIARTGVWSACLLAPALALEVLSMMSDTFPTLTIADAYALVIALVVAHIGWAVEQPLAMIVRAAVAAQLVGGVGFVYWASAIISGLL